MRFGCSDMWKKNMIEPDRPQITICRMGSNFSTIKTIDALAEYVILIAINSKYDYSYTPQYYVTRTLPSCFI